MTTMTTSDDNLFANAMAQRNMRDQMFCWQVMQNLHAPPKQPMALSPTMWYVAASVPTHQA